MKAVVTRVREASVTIDGACCGKIGKGFLVLLGVGPGDTEKEAERMADKVCGLRVFEDEAEALADVLTPESRQQILTLKAAEPEGSGICGMEFCRAVLEGHVTNWEEFLSWRRKEATGFFGRTSAPG